tara:strand:+ start:424 stop:1134 length:711 start_codon:yes stop_codon:yes gene_type:complete
MKLILENWNNFVNEQEDEGDGKTNSIFVLVGPPSIGKSTWIKSTFKEMPYTINRDDIVEKVASSYGWTYDDMFASPPQDAKVGEEDQKFGKVIKSPSWMTWQATVFDKVLEANGKVQKLFNSRVAGAAPSGKDIVIDMTNMNSGARARALAAIKGSEDSYKKVAVVFDFEGVEDAIQAIAQKRAEAAKRMGKSKTIPTAAFKRMFGSFQKVESNEGFDEIVSVDNRQLLQKLANEE